jgi:hypothetical protein
VVGSGVVVAATAPAIACGRVMGKYQNSTITFNARRQNQRTGATIVGNTVYFGFSSHCDLYYYAGWVLGYDINTFKLVGEDCKESTFVSVAYHLCDIHKRPCAMASFMLTVYLDQSIKKEQFSKHDTQGVSSLPSCHEDCISCRQSYKGRINESNRQSLSYLMCRIGHRDAIRRP